MYRYSGDLGFSLNVNASADSSGGKYGGTVFDDYRRTPQELAQQAAPAPAQPTGPYVSSAESGGLIMDDTTAAQSMIPRTKMPAEYCRDPGGLCFSDPAFGQMVRTAMRGGCDHLKASLNLQNAAKGVGSYGGLGGTVDCGEPVSRQITPQNLGLFVQTYGPCVLQNVPDCKIPFSPCPLSANTCIDSRYLDVLETAQTQCQFNYTPEGSNLGCPSASSVVGPKTAHRFSPCELAKLKMCTDRPPEDWTFIPLDVQGEGGEEDDNSKYIVGGLLALLALGGIAYAVTRKKKNKGRK